MKPRQYLGLCILVVCMGITHAQTCLDAASESHHKVLFDNKDIRVLSLQLGRLESTADFCYAFPAMLIGTTAGQTNTWLNGGPSSSFDWLVGQVMLQYPPQQTRIQNTAMNPHRVIIIETKHAIIPIVAEDGTLIIPVVPAFSLNSGSTDPSWIAPFALGSLKGMRMKLDPGASSDLNDFDHVIIALNDLHLKTAGELTIQIPAGEINILRAGRPVKLTNAAATPALFVSVDF